MLMVRNHHLRLAIMGDVDVDVILTLHKFPFDEADDVMLFFCLVNDFHVNYLSTGTLPLPVVYRVIIP